MNLKRYYEYIRDSIIDCGKSCYSSSNAPAANYKMNMLWFYGLSLKRKSFPRTKRVFFHKIMMFYLWAIHMELEWGEGIIPLHLPRRGAALTQCEHANGLTSTTTSGLHTYTYTTNTHRVHLTPQQGAPISIILTTTSCWQEKKRCLLKVLWGCYEQNVNVLDCSGGISMLVTY